MGNGYSISLGESEWFFSIDLPPVFFACVWEMIQNQGVRLSEDAVWEAVVVEYEDKLDRLLLDRAWWEAAKGTLGEVLDDKSITKVFHALGKSYWPVLDEVLEATIDAEIQGWLSPEQELQRVELFMKRWIDDSMGRCFAAIQDSDSLLTADRTETLFRTLLAPFGNDDPFSCIPCLLTETIGRPPSDWAYITQALEELFASRGGPSKKRRKAAAVEEAAAPAPVARFVGNRKVAVKAAGHPSCTSETDCIGTTEDALIQHMMEGEAGDVYCQQCWDSFVRRNPQLEGVMLE